MWGLQPLWLSEFLEATEDYLAFSLLSSRLWVSLDPHGEEILSPWPVWSAQPLLQCNQVKCWHNYLLLLSIWLWTAQTWGSRAVLESLLGKPMLPLLGYVFFLRDLSSRCSETSMQVLKRGYGHQGACHIQTAWGTEHGVPSPALSLVLHWAHGRVQGRKSEGLGYSDNA